MCMPSVLSTQNKSTECFLPRQEVWYTGHRAFIIGSSGVVENETMYVIRQGQKTLTVPGSALASQRPGQ